jgi:hypothetical protein
MRKFSKISLLSVSLALSVQFVSAANTFEFPQDQYTPAIDNSNRQDNFANQNNGYNFLENNHSNPEINTNNYNENANSSYGVFENGNITNNSNYQDYNRQSVQGNYETSSNLNNYQFQNVNPQNQTEATGSVDKFSQQSFVEIKNAPGSRTPNSSDVPDNGSDPVDTPINSGVYVLLAIAVLFGFKSKFVIENK